MRESILPIMKNVTTARNDATSITTSRRPPRIRSTNGPMKGVTIENGARLSARKRITLPRAASGLIDKKSEFARATVIAASPAVINACVRVRTKRPDRGGNPTDSDSERAMRRS